MGFKLQQGKTAGLWRSKETARAANIFIRVGRKITWDAKAEQIVGDSQANLMLSRPQRREFEIVA